VSEAGVERRLTAILAADVVGYSQLMAADESGTLASLKALRRELIEPKTAEFHGRVVKLMLVVCLGSLSDSLRAYRKRPLAVAKPTNIRARLGIAA
jgi:adenylate cyclase